jgi:hypothetical protein
MPARPRYSISKKGTKSCAKSSGKLTLGYDHRYRRQKPAFGTEENTDHSLDNGKTYFPFPRNVA